MAERKPPTRRPAKGPTKAAALKALGLTEKDLEVLKSLHEGVEAAKSFEGKEAETSVVEVATDRDSVWYVRNAHYVDVSFRLVRQQKQDEKRTNLNPRGQRGDMRRLEPGDLKDSELQTQLAYGLVEIIPEGEALEIIKKQSVNQVRAVPAHIAALRNEKGQEYAEGAITVHEDNSIKVADLKPVTSEHGDVVVTRGGIQRVLAPQNQTPTGGNPAIISDGFNPVQNTGQLGQVDAAAMAKDALARSKNFEGPGAGTGTVNVVVEPVRRT